MRGGGRDCASDVFSLHDNVPRPPSISGKRPRYTRATKLDSSGGRKKKGTRYIGHITVCIRYKDSGGHGAWGRRRRRTREQKPAVTVCFNTEHLLYRISKKTNRAHITQGGYWFIEGTARGHSNVFGLTSCRNRETAGRGWLISNFGFDGNVTLVAGKILGVVGLTTGTLASGDPTYVCFDCCRVTIVAICSGSLDPELAIVKPPVAFDDVEKPFLCPGGGGSLVKSVKT